MKLEGMLLFIVMAAVVKLLTTIITALPYFKKEGDLISYLKFLISLGFAESLTIPFVFLTKGGMVLAYFKMTNFIYLDAVLSGLLISNGPDLLQGLYQTIVTYREKIQAQAEAKVLEKIQAEDLANIQADIIRAKMTKTNGKIK